MILRNFYKYALFIALCVSVFGSCRPEAYTPRPRGYYAVHFPKHEYRIFDWENYPFTFEYPVYATVSKDTVNKDADNPYWLNMYFNELGGQVYMSYKRIVPPSITLDRLLEEAHFMSYYHTKKADYINDPAFVTANGVTGVFYDVGGDAASAYQFWATDSTRNFIRGALYFNNTPNADSLRPVNEFIRVDLEHMIQTLKWK